MMKNISKIIISTLLLITIFTCTVNSVAADGMIIPEQVYMVPYEPMPSLEIKNYPEIKYHIVNVTINNHYVITHVDQEFYNPYDKILVGTYIFPVPEGAVLSNFTVIIDGEKKSAHAMDADEAKELFQQSVVEMNDASLLQYLDNNIFSCEVTIPGDSSIKMSLQYEEVLTMDGGMYRYMYTLSTEQYSSSDIDNVSVTVDINSDKNIDAVYCPSHTITTERISSNKVLVNYAVSNARPDTDFELYYSVTDQGFGASLLLFDEDDEDFFMLFFNSNGQQSETEDLISKDIIFVVDESGSMSGEKIEQAKDALKWILQKLGQNDRFSIINFDSNIDAFSDELENVNSKMIEDALKYVDGINAGGSTNINDALLTAIGMFETAENSNSPRIIFFLTDGLPTSGETNEGKITDNVRNANIDGGVDASIFVFGVGYDVNTHLLDKISNENHGSRTYIDPGESIETKLIELYSKIENPLLTDISIELSGMDIFEAFPDSIPNLYEGSEIVLVGKCNDLAQNVKVFVNGSKGEESVEFVFDFETNSDSKNSFIPRIWATRKIGMLMDKVKLEGGTEELTEEIKGLGLKYGIVTPYTSLLIEEQNGGVTYGMEENQKDEDNDGIADAWEISGKRSNAQSKINHEYQCAYSPVATTGANIQIQGNKVFADIDGTQIDLKLLGNITSVELGNGTVEDWVMVNLDVTKVVTFGSDEYFKLLENEEFVEALSAGTEVVFQQGNESYYVLQGELPVTSSSDPIETSGDEKTKGKETPGLETMIFIVSIGVALIILRKVK